MPERDSSIDVDNLPTIQVEKREPTDSETSSPSDDYTPPPAQPRPRQPIAAYVLIIFCFAAIGALFWQLQQQSELLDNARDRVAELESRLSNTDESMTQSGVAVQVKLKELKDRSDELWTQMDKLWASAWRRNQKEITDHGKKLESHGKTLKELKQGFLVADKSSSSIKADLAVLKAEVEELADLESRIAAQKKVAASLKKDIASLEKSLAKLNKTTKSNSEWIESINAFRKQSNQSMSRLEQRINTLHPTQKQP